MEDSEINIADAIDLALAKLKGEKNFNQKIVIQAWNKICPPSALSSIKKIFLNENILNIYLSSPILKHSFQINKLVLIQKLNAKQNKILIEDIFFY